LRKIVLDIQGLWWILVRRRSDLRGKVDIKGNRSEEGSTQSEAAMLEATIFEKLKEIVGYGLAIWFQYSW
jgi:hypothetical protein